MTQKIALDLRDAQTALAQGIPPSGKIEIDPDTIEKDLARLLLGLMEFLRQIMELRAIERLENGQLTEDQEEKLGTTLMRAEKAIQEMAEKFGLSPEDLSLDLGPLGRTI